MRRWSSGCSRRCSAAATRRRSSRKSRCSPTRATIRWRWRAQGARSARWGASRKPTRRIARPPPASRAIQRFRRDGASCSSRNSTGPTRSSRSRWRCRPTRGGRRRWWAPRGRSKRRTPRRPSVSPSARTALEASFKADPYNTLTYNLLQMMDRLDQFVTVRDGDLILRMHKDEAPVLQEYAVALAHQALNTMSARYEFAPRGPILIEIFPRHDDFAVRTLGLPGMIGALGVCFGRVVTMDSPKARPPGDFQWEATLWHELGHVITLQMSNQRVPRWLTEGISEYEEQRARAEWRRDMDLMFAGLLNRGEALKLKDLNAAFQDPKTISLAYYEGSLVVEHIITEYGQAGLNKLLRTFSQGLDTDAALKATFNLDFVRMQSGFDQMVEKKFGAMRRAMAVPPGVDEMMKMSSAAMKTVAG